MEIKETWNKLFKYWDTLEKQYRPSCVGAMEKDILYFEKNQKFSFIFPKDLRESLKICNNKSYSIESIRNGKEWGKFNKNKLYSLFNKEPKNIPTYMIEIFSLDDMIKRRYINDNSPEEWIPLFYFEEIWAVLDMRKGKQEQILLINHEDFELKEYFWASSYIEWLDMIVNELIEHQEVRRSWLFEIMDQNKVLNF